MASLPSSGIMRVSTSIIINAPITEVWSVLLDFDSYTEWNPFRRNQVIVDPVTKRPRKDKMLSEGDLVLADPVHIPATMEPVNGRLWMSVLLKCILYDPVNHRQAWTSINSYAPNWMLHPVRWDTLIEEDGKTKYESVEFVNGLMAYLLRYFMQDSLQLAFDEMAKALKDRVEGLSQK